MLYREKASVLDIGGQVSQMLLLRLGVGVEVSLVLPLWMFPNFHRSLPQARPWQDEPEYPGQE